jgi:NAD(P)-dependent dehydrogenase (short-subunit alcohol dehydrogenase family)
MGYFKDGLLSGRNAFISGGTSGINLAIAEALLDAGATVGVMSRKPEKVDSALALLSLKGKAYGYSADVRNFDAVSSAMEQFHQAAGPIDIVISGAAGNFVAPANSMSSNGFKTVLEIDLLGSFHVYRSAYPFLRKPGASLISISAPQATETSFGQSHVAAPIASFLAPLMAPKAWTVSHPTRNFAVILRSPWHYGASAQNRRWQRWRSSSRRMLQAM